MLRVCIVAPVWGTGGQAVEAKTLLDGLGKEPGMQVEVVPIDPRIPAPLARIPAVRTLIRLPLYYGRLLGAMLRADVLHVFTAAFWPFALTTTPAILLGRLFRRPVILNYRDGRARAHLRFALVRWILRRATVLVFPSGFLKDLFEEFGLSGTVISNVVDTRRFVFRARTPLRPILLSPRLLEELYAVENTILALQALQATYPDARLLIVGGGDQRPALERLVTERGIPGVQFIGNVPHSAMGGWYDQADVMVNSSRIDNMPHCLIEAFAAGLAIVTTPSGGIPHLVQHERNGLIVPCDDPQAMAAAVVRLLENPDLAQTLIHNGWTDCELRYAWSAAKRDWEHLYASLLRRTPPKIR